MLILLSILFLTFQFPNDLLRFPGGSDGKVSACSAGDLGLISGLGRSSGGGNGNPLQYSCLDNSIEEPGRLQSMGLQRVGHDWVTLLSLSFQWPFNLYFPSSLVLICRLLGFKFELCHLWSISFSTGVSLCIRFCVWKNEGNNCLN